MKKLMLLLCAILYSLMVTAQVGIGTNTPDKSAILDLSTTTQGFLLPRLSSAERNQINNGNIAKGLMIYNTDSNTLQVFDGTDWYTITMEKVEPEAFVSTKIENNDFENWENKQLQNWNIKSEGITLEEENTIVFSKERSVKVVLNTSDQALTDFRQKIQLDVGDYQMSFQVYHADDASRVRLYVDGFKNYSTSALINQWQTVVYDFSITENKIIEIGFRFYDTDSFVDSSIVYLDKVELVTK